MERCTFMGFGLLAATGPARIHRGHRNVPTADLGRWFPARIKLLALATISIGVTLALLTLHATVHGQQRETVRVVAILSEGVSLPASRSGVHQTMAGGIQPEVSRKSLTEALDRLGYVENQKFRFEEGIGAPYALSSLASVLVSKKPDLIIAVGTPAAIAAKAATSTIPVVMVGVVDPVQLRLVASLAHPGSNVTGISFQGSEVVAKSVQLLQEATPKASRMMLLLNSNNPGAVLAARDAAEGAKKLNIRLVPVEVDGRAERQSKEQGYDLLDSMRGKESFDGLIVVDDQIFTAHRKLIIMFAAVHKIPTMFHLRDAVVEGGLMCYGPSTAAMFERAASQVVKILKGAKPSDLPVEQPTKFDLLINLKTAKTLGLTIPDSLLRRADEIIQ